MREFIIIGNKHTRKSLIPKFSVTFLKSSIMPEEEVKSHIPFDAEKTFLPCLMLYISS